MKKPPPLPSVTLSIALLGYTAGPLAGDPVTVFSDDFDAAGEGGPNTITDIPGWTEEGLTTQNGNTLDNAGLETNHTTTGRYSLWLNTGAGHGGLRQEAVYADTDTPNSNGTQFTLTYDLIGRTPYTGDFFAQIWAGTPGVGTLLGEHIGINPPAGTSQTNELVVNGTSDPGNIFIRFHATDWNGPEDSGFQQARVDTVVLTADGLVPGAPFQIRIDADNTNLDFIWDSQAGKVYDILSSTDPETDGDPATWSVVPGQEGLVATPPTNMRTIARPVDATRLYVVRERNAPPPPPAFFDDFETVQSWTVGANGGDAGTTVWQRGAPTNVGPLTGFDDSVNCFGTNISANYTLNTDIWLRSPPINLAGGGITGATLSFYQHRDTDIDTDVDDDYGTVRVLDANTFTQLGADIATDVEGFDFDGNNSPIWVESSATPLPAEAIGKEIVLEFRFKTDNEAGIFSGWYIDDVLVETE